ncbi:MAG: ADP-forming succinate--CoA ligase subunit beta [Candidatus Ranarchaeia archaeon]
MKLFEYEAKDIFKQMGILTPSGKVSKTPRESYKIAEEMNCPVVIKAQILIGGRGKAGGVKFAENPEEASKLTEEILKMKISNYPVTSVLIEEKLQIEKEFYIGFTVDREEKKYVAIFSLKGGVDIEEIAQHNPNDVIKMHVDPSLGFRDYHARIICRIAGITGKEAKLVSKLLSQLWKVIQKFDAELIEINPAILTIDEKLIAADGKMVIDENALYRQKEIVEKLEGDKVIQDNSETLAEEIGVNYVSLNGNIGIIGNGAGLVMATMDSVFLEGGKPANFLDVGGGANAKQMEKSLEIVLSRPQVKGVFINILGGVTRCDEMAKGIIAGRGKLKKKIPIVIRLVGTREKEGQEILRKAGVKVIDSMDQAAKEIVRIVRD